jgi:multimeric flavodoxin WrbA
VDHGEVLVTSVTVAVVYHSVSGRTRALAEAVAKGAASVPDAAALVLDVEEATSARGLSALSAAEAIVLGAPTYMGSASAAFKAFMDATSAIWALQGWRDKLAAGFTHSAAPSGDKLGTLVQLAVFAAQHGMVWVGLGLPPTYASAESTSGDGRDDTNRLGSHLGAMAQSRPGGGALPAGDLATAELLGRRVAGAALRWRSREAPESTRTSRSQVDGPASPPRHFTTRAWSFPPKVRAELPEGIERINLKELVARPERHEHHLIACATIDDARLEIATASEPLYFAHINVSDEYAVALPTGDELVDRFPLRTFLTEPENGQDVGRYNHRIGDLVLHPLGLLHWPGRLREPWQPFDFPPGMRRCGLSLVYCASKPTPHAASPLAPPSGRENDAKAYTVPPPPMALASLRSSPGPLAKIGRTELSLLELPSSISPPNGGWLVVLEADPESAYDACDLLRIPAGTSLDGAGLSRALLLTSEAAPPDPVPPSWTALPKPPFPAFEDRDAATADGSAGSSLPFEEAGVRVTEVSSSLVDVTVNGATVQVPRYWLARTIFRVALHPPPLGYLETYGRAFFDDRDGDLDVGVRSAEGMRSVTIARGDVHAFLERLYRAVAPPGYRERPT